MARDTSPQCKQCRREGQKLFLKGERCLTDKCGVERRSYPPGEHGRGRQKQSEYRVQLREKQKARRYYGVLEKQFRTYYEKASRQPGITGENLLRILECRFDNVLVRLGFAASRRQARQLIRHGHWTINGSKQFITNSGTAITRFVTVTAVTGQRDGKNEISTIIVPNGTPGFTVEPAYDKVGWHASDTHPLTFQDVRVPEENLLGQRGRGYANFLHTLDEGRIAIAALATGSQGWLVRRCGPLERAILIVCGLALVYPAPASDIVGIVGVVAVYFWQKLRRVAPA